MASEPRSSEGLGGTVPDGKDGQGAGMDIDHHLLQRSPSGENVREAELAVQTHPLRHLRATQIGIDEQDRFSGLGQHTEQG